MAGVLSPVRGGTRASSSADVDLVTRCVVASALVGSAVIHGTVAGEHFGEWVIAGDFFLTIQAVELVLALLAVRSWTRGAALLVVVTGMLTVATWLVSRTWGMPVGPADFRVPEPVGVPDAACGVLELMSVVAALVALPLLRSGSDPRRRTGPSRRGVAIATTAVWAAVVLTVWGSVPTVLGVDGHHHGVEAGSPAP
jgi:hypothetical protein